MSRSEAKAWDVDESVIHEEEGKFWTPPCHGDDVLYARETWNYGYVDSDWKEGCPPEYWFEELDWKGKDHDFLRGISRFWYMADGEDLYGLKWKPSIHMPREAARIFLKVKRVRAERLKDITEEDAAAEGCQAHGVAENALERFMMVWNSTMSLEDRRKYGFWKNPWVWVIEFERMEVWP